MTQETEDRRARVDALFAAALEREAGHRPAFLRGACGDDGTLRAEVEELLRLADLPFPPVDDGAPALDELRREALDAVLSAAEPEAEGTRVGPYRLGPEIGRGGMGVVHLAERSDGQFEQRVAVKLVRRGMATDEIEGRFRRERQILARLAHPGIARLLDGGVTEDGRAYFAMEYVDGEPVDRYCDRVRLPVRERVELLSRVGEAVQFAHGNLVVHRDLKPGNILVTADGQVLLLDFGIAALLEEGREGPLTRAGTGPMTPDYASPEQLRGEPVTTASDVYQLGILLHVLLAGSRPAPDPAAAPRASAAAAGAEDLAALSAARRTTPRGLVRELRGDLDTIVATALRPEPERRYATAQQLVDDLRRHLSGRPVLARGDSVSYRARRFARRHRAGLAAALLSLLAATGYVVTVARQAREIARERDRVKTEAAKVAQVRDFLVGLFAGADPSTPEAQTITARELLERGDARVRAELEGQPEVEAELLDVIGTLHASLGSYDLAVDRLRTALALRKAVHGERSDPYADTLFHLADVLREKGSYDEAESRFRETLALRRALHGEDHPAVARVLDNLGLTYAEKGDYARAEPMIRQALSILRRHEGEESPVALGTLGNLALTLKWKGDFAAAEPLLREALALTRKIRGERHLDTAWATERLGVFLGQRGDPRGAEPLMVEALRMAEALLGDSHPDVALMTNNLAKLYAVSGRPGEAEPLFRRALALNRKLFGPRHHRVGINLGNLGDVVCALGRHAEAIPLLAESLSIRREQLGPRHPETALALQYLGRAHLSLGQAVRAWEIYREAVRVARAAWEADHPFRADVLAGAAEAALSAGSRAEAVPLAAEALAIRERALPPGHESTRNAAELLARASGRPAR